MRTLGVRRLAGRKGRVWVRYGPSPSQALQHILESHAKEPLLHSIAALARRYAVDEASLANALKHVSAFAVEQDGEEGRPYARPVRPRSGDGDPSLSSSR